jgi:hypothetical protein
MEELADVRRSNIYGRKISSANKRIYSLLFTHRYAEGTPCRGGRCSHL